MTLSANPRLAALYPILAGLSGDAAERLAKHTQVVDLPAGFTVFDEHQACQGFPFVLAGSIRVVKAAPSGRELPLYRVTPGETCIISSACLLGRAPYNARGVTETPTTLLLLPIGEFQALLGEPPFRDFVFQLFSERIADLMQLIEEVAFRKLDQRLAALLLGKGQRLNTTHQHLADELGSVREIVSRLLKGFAEQGLVALSREQVEILNPAGLRRIATG
ncbi:Crp/Fnr family transcriptional regulator [Zoogloea sp.]|uniref:Crp/Fnr family transcriptional regulator n=1 Tax=Zoogloea sp. TaxID=49181 RepID=UPI002602188E|nr:Crp/Fnr family transcriptional regulator [Zoogloea sp.]MDD3352112.1 Crp/Fnr family transcriptional regulator [Zoogloea sp.]